VEKQLEHEKGVKNIDIDYVTDSVIIVYDPLLITKEEIRNKLEILHIADKENIDAIIVGSRGLEGLSVGKCLIQD
jgi:hypothetical protein